MDYWRRRKSLSSPGSFHETFRHRARSGSAELLFSEVRNAYDPNSTFITTWQQMMLLCILYELVVLPFTATFDHHTVISRSRMDLLGVYLCEIFFYIDIYVRSNTGYYEDGDILRDRSKSRMKYLKSAGFVMDLLALPPLSLLPIQNFAVYPAVFEFHKLTRIWRVPSLISNLDNIYARYFVVLKMAKILGITFVVSHLIACARFSFGYDVHLDNHWLPEFPEHAQNGRTRYLMSLFWAFGLLTGLFEGELPHTNAQFAFTIFVALCGFSLFTYLCATFFMLSKCESADTETSEARVNQFKHLLAFHRVPETLQRQAVEYLKRYYTLVEANDREAAKLLCPSISIDIQIELLKDTVARIPVFQGCGMQFIKAMTSLLELDSYPAHFILFRAGDHGDAMYIVNSGVLRTLVNGVNVRELRKGNFFGEVAVFANIPRSATMITATYCTLYKLSRFHAEKLLEGYPRHARQISHTINEMLKKDNQQEQTSENTSMQSRATMTRKSLYFQASVKMAMSKRGMTQRFSFEAAKSRVIPEDTNEHEPRISPPPALSGLSKKVAPADILSVSANSVGYTSTTVDKSGINPQRGNFTAISSAPTSLPSRKVHPTQSNNSSTKKNIAPFDNRILPEENVSIGQRRWKLASLQASLLNGHFGLGDEKPIDVIKGFYEKMGVLGAPAPPTKYWWRKILLKKCIDAESRVRMAWILVLQLILCYNWAVIPLCLAFPINIGPTSLVWILNAVADGLLWVDIYLNFNLSFSISSEKITDTTRSAERYFRSWKFLLDILCAFPYTTLATVSVQQMATRIPRLARVWYLKDHFVEVQEYFLINSRKRLFFFGFLLFMLYHVVACLHFSVTYLEGFSSKEDAWIPSDDIYLKRVNDSCYRGVDGEVYEADRPEVRDIQAKQYFRSLYYATNVLAGLNRTIEPDSDIQYAIALAFMLSGFLITAIVVDNVQQRFTASAFEQKEFFATRARIQRFLKRQNAPLSIHQRVNSFLDFWWSSHRGAIIGELLQELPETIKRDITRSICTPAIETLWVLFRSIDKDQTILSLFEAPSDEARLRLETLFLDNLRFILYGQDEIIYRCGDYAAGLFFLLEGKVSLTLDGDLPWHVPLGGFFGTAALSDISKTDSVTNASTVTVGYAEHATAVSGCIVVYMPKEQLETMENLCPSLSIALRKLEKRLQETKVSRSSQIECFSPEASLLPLKLIKSRTIYHWVTDRLVFFLSLNNSRSINPDSTFITLWETWTFFAMTTQCVLVIYYSCFGVVSDGTSVYVHADTVTILFELCFLVDIYIRSRLGYYEYGNKVMDLQTVRRHYFCSIYFLVDVVAIIPLFMLNWFLPLKQRIELMNANKLLRLYKAPSQFKSLESKHIKLTMELRLFKLVYYTFLASHLFGSVWFDFAANTSGFGALGNTKEMAFGANKWLPGTDLQTADRSFQYFASLFWSFGLMSASSPGDPPKTVSQCVFTILTMTVGFFLFAYVIGNFSDVIELQDSENRHFVAKLGSLRHLLQHFKLPTSVEEKFKTYFFFKRFHSITQEHVLERVLPPSLVVDIRMFQLQPMIVKVAFLAGMEDSVTRMLVSLFTQILFLRDEYICKFGEEGSEMFFIFTGVLDIYVPATQQSGSTASINNVDEGAKTNIRELQKVNQITAGSYFGEAALFTKAPRNAYVKAKTSCILYKLSRKSLELVFERYPDWKQKVLRIVKIQQEQQRLSRLAVQIQTEDGRKGEKHKASPIDTDNNRVKDIEETLFSFTRAGCAKAKSPSSWPVFRIFKKSSMLSYLSRRLKMKVERIVKNTAALLVDDVEVQSKGYLIWLRMISICTVYMALLVPYRLSYDSLARWNAIPITLRIGEIICELAFWGDIWFHFRVRSNQQAMELYEQDHLQAYKRERLIWDLIAAFPIDHFILRFIFNSSDLITMRKWMRLNRCFKVRNLVYYQNEANRRSVSYELNRAQTYWLLYLLAMFWTSCAYFAVSMYDGFGNEWQAWLPAEELEDPDLSPCMLLLRVFRGLFFATTTFMKKGRTFVPHSTLNCAFSVLICFVGQLIMALMIGEMANLFILYIGNEVQFRKNHISVELYLGRRKVSNHLKLRASAFLTSWWSSHAGVNYQTIFDELPPSVRTEGISFIAEKPLVSFLERVFRPLTIGIGNLNSANNVMESLKYSIAKCLRFEGYPRDEDVIVEGNVCNDMYFVVRGHLFSKSISNPFLYHARRYSAGNYFGEHGLLGHSVSLFTVSTARSCDLFVLRSQELLEVLNTHEYFHLILKMVQDMVRQHKTVEEYFYNDNTTSTQPKNQISDKKRRRVSAPSTAMPASPSSSMNSEDKHMIFEAHLTKLFRESNNPDWIQAFGLFMEMIRPSGSLNDLEDQSNDNDVNNNRGEIVQIIATPQPRRAQSTRIITSNGNVNEPIIQDGKESVLTSDGSHEQRFIQDVEATPGVEGSAGNGRPHPADVSDEHLKDTAMQYTKEPHRLSLSQQAQLPTFSTSLQHPIVEEEDEDHEDAKQ